MFPGEFQVMGEKVAPTLEIVFVARVKAGQYPGIFLFSGAARMMRPVYNLAARRIELIGTFEQVRAIPCQQFRCRAWNGRSWS